MQKICYQGNRGEGEGACMCACMREREGEWEKGWDVAPEYQDCCCCCCRRRAQHPTPASISAAAFQPSVQHAHEGCFWMLSNVETARFSLPTSFAEVSQSNRIASAVFHPSVFLSTSSLVTSLPFQVCLYLYIDSLSIFSLLPPSLPTTNTSLSQSVYTCLLSPRLAVSFKLKFTSQIP